MGVGLRIDFFRVTIHGRFGFGSDVVVEVGVVGGIFTALVEGDQLAGDSGKGVGQAEVEVDLGFGRLRAKRFGEQDLAELGDGELEADFGEISRVFGAEEVEQRILLEGGGLEPSLKLKPILVAAAVPIGNVARRDMESKLSERGGDVAVPGTVIEHLVNEVTLGFRKGRDFAITPAICDLEFMM